MKHVSGGRCRSALDHDWQPLFNAAVPTLWKCSKCDKVWDCYEEGRMPHAHQHDVRVFRGLLVLLMVLCALAVIASIYFGGS